MLYLAFSLIHNRGTSGNRQQLVALRALLTLTGDATDPETGDPTGRRWYTLNGLAQEHEVKVYQVVPFGVNRPNNMDTLMSHNVIYGVGDEDKTASHPRFVNWSIKRGLDYGAALACVVVDAAALTTVDLAAQIVRMAADEDLVFIERDWGDVATPRLFRDVGQLREDVTLTASITDLNNRIAAEGLRSA
jgi:hypothetical protein